MPSYTLTVCSSPNDKELIIANGYLFGMLGVTEEASQDSLKLTFYYANIDILKTAQEDLKRQFESIDCTVAEVADRDWNAEWKASMQPAVVSPGIWVSPLWLKPTLSNADHWIKIEPKTAFGTGHHATTRLAAQGLKIASSMLPANFSVLDIGSGTGILCFTAKICNSGFTLGVDIDPMCAENMAENRTNNPPFSKCEFLIGELSAIKATGIFDCIIMNMIQTESEPQLPSICRLIKSPGYLAWSGILAAEKDCVITAAKNFGFSLLNENFEDEWWGGVFKK